MTDDHTVTPQASLDASVEKFSLFPNEKSLQTDEDATKPENILDLFLPILRRYVDQLKTKDEPELILSTPLDDASEWIYSIRHLRRMLEVAATIEGEYRDTSTYDFDLEVIDKVCKLFSSLKLTKSAPEDGECRWHASICSALSDFAERLAGERAVALLTPDVLEFLVKRLGDRENIENVYFALSALERFAQTRENKNKIIEAVGLIGGLKELESWSTSDDRKKRQIGFMAQWGLDNIFVTEGRVFSYETAKTEGINAMLDQNDSSPRLKISPDGLEARNDARGFFESTKCTFGVRTGVWYYEAEIVSEGLMQIGWATKKAKFQESDGRGVGDDDCSIGYDGARNLIWYNKEPKYLQTTSWKVGDILGCLIDMDGLEVAFYLNGIATTPVDESQQTELFKHRSGFFPAASFSFRQQCHFNFGHRPFRFPPADKPIQIINDVAKLTAEQRTILPRAKKRNLLILRQESILSTITCFLCRERPALVILMPCEHDGYCCECALKLDECALCRASISQRVLQQH